MSLVKTYRQNGYKFIVILTLKACHKEHLLLSLTLKTYQLNIDRTCCTLVQHSLFFILLPSKLHPNMCDAYLCLYCLLFEFSSCSSNLPASCFLLSDLNWSSH
jgi:hypothetical protein